MTRQVSWDNCDERSERPAQGKTTFTLCRLCMKQKVPSFLTKSYSCGKIYRVYVTEFPTGTDFLQTAAKFKEKTQGCGLHPAQNQSKSRIHEASLTTIDEKQYATVNKK